MTTDDWKNTVCKCGCGKTAKQIIDGHMNRKCKTCGAETDKKYCSFDCYMRDEKRND